MFGSQLNARMPNNQLYSNFKDIQTNTNRLQFFSSLFNTNQITYLDPHKMYCIIQSEKYNKIKEELSSSLKNQQSLQKTAYEVNLANIGLNQQIKIYRQQLQKLRNNQQKYRQQYEIAAKACKQYQKSLLLLKQQQNKRYSQQPIPQKDKNIPLKTYINQECQTEVLLTSEQQVNLVNVQSNSVALPQVEIAEQKLYELVRSEMQKFQQEFENKICELEQAKLNIGKWEEENTLLRQQNEQLKQKIVERNMQEQKLTIWRKNIHQFVSKIQHSITHPSSKHSQRPQGEQSNEQVHRLKEQVLDLRGRIVEMRNKMKRVEDIMEVEGDINDDGAIGILVRTAQKFKQIVKGMIMEVEQI